MYEYLSGQLTLRKPGVAVIDVAGVGYRVEISLSTYRKLPREGSVKLLTYLKVAEDDLRIYGFATQQERELFLRLMAVQSLGPSKAIAILSSVEAEELARAIEEGDVSLLQSVKGVGESIAKRLVVELKGKLPSDEGLDGEDTSLSKDAVEALVRLGYDRRLSADAVRRARRDLGDGVSVEEVIRRSLANV